MQLIRRCILLGGGGGGGGSIPGIIFRSFIQVGQLKKLWLYFITLTLNETLKNENNVNFCCLSASLWAVFCIYLIWLKSMLTHNFFLKAMLKFACVII